MAEMVETRRNADRVERYDLFSGLLDAAQDEQGGERALSNEELIGGYIRRRDRSHFRKVSHPSPGNMFIFLFAGHEVRSFPLLAVFSQNGFLQTTAHTLCFTFALLALYPDEQERLYQHIKGVMSSLNGTPVGSRNVNSYRELIFNVDLRGHEPLHAIVGVRSFDFFCWNEDSYP